MHADYNQQRYNIEKVTDDDDDDDSDDVNVDDNNEMIISMISIIIQ